MTTEKLQVSNNTRPRKGGQIDTIDFEAGAKAAGLAAQRLAGNHRLPVFPCRPDKGPYTPKGFHDATTDAAAICRWWKRWPWAFIGVPTGHASGVLVIDVDPR